MKRWWSIFLVSLLVTGSARAQTNAPAALQDVGIDQRLGELVPLELTFRDEEGRAVKLEQYFGQRPVVIALVYYECPMLCTLILNGMVKAFRPLTFNPGQEFEIVTVSIDPREKPALAADKKKGYLREYSRRGAETGWHFLTGDDEAIQKLAAAVGYRYKYDAASDQYAHAAGIMVATPQGKLARYFYGIEYSTRDIRLGLVEAAEGKIGSPVDQILLYCFHYDPVSGSYGVAILRVLRVAGLLTVAALAAFIVVMVRRDRRRKAQP